MNHFNYTLSLLLIILSSVFSFGQDMPTVVIRGEIDEKTEYSNYNVIIKGKTLTVNEDLKLNNCEVTIHVENIRGGKKIKIENDALHSVVFTNDNVVISSKVDIKNANSTILSSQLSTEEDAHLKFENGTLICNNSTWNLDGHVDFQAHDSFIDSLHVFMNNVAINELSDKIHYKENVGWDFVGGCISPYQKEHAEASDDDQRPGDFIDCSNLTDSLNYFEGDVRFDIKTELEWGMYLEEHTTSYLIYTSKDNSNWSLLEVVDASNPDPSSPVRYFYSDFEERYGTVNFRLSSINNGNEINLDTITIEYSDELPVEMIYFEPEIFDEGISLFWATATEINSSHFEVQYSTDNKDWIKIAEVKSAGNSNSKKEYQYDDIMRYGTTYYRLKQVDLDGKYEYFGPVTVQVEGEESFDAVIFPVPQAAGMDINIQTNNDAPYELVIFNNIGQLIYHEKDLQHTTTFATPWGRGVFVVHIMQGRSKIVKKFQLD
ncbi:T9SS type A sorting domain-containing protein [Flammeovirga aprica]|uniref:T9SS type A sorting domain-containing protein n=1 Tax=Flammeovirga aprica JL-4 TaxID=694437 RepID=A0A7X9XD06_9BACT|nr:T9SS type A sorting domain-containing protein [Flammeovirga aprica]NME72149.1 T9SS type A sorting domain-containing protein [Flammeovirga aprica JL-4]